MALWMMKGRLSPDSGDGDRVLGDWDRVPGDGDRVPGDGDRDGGRVLRVFLRGVGDFGVVDLVRGCLDDLDFIGPVLPFWRAILN